MLREKVFLVGPRWKHHSSHSGYESFHRYIGTLLQSPVKNRYLSGRLGNYPYIGDLGWKIDQVAAALTPISVYSPGLFLIEITAGLHMFAKRNSIYHVLYGDSEGWLLGYTKRLRGNKLVATFHNPSPILDWLSIDKIARNLDAVVILSESQRSFFDNILTPDRIHLIPHGVDTEFFQPAEKTVKEPICITVGSKLRDFTTYKLAIDTILEKYPEVQFIAVGAKRTDSNVPRLEHSRVQFIDNISDQDLLRLYQSSMVAVFPLLDATANNSLLEAMSCGLPIVATDVGGVREYLGDETGILCPPYDPVATADAVLKILNDSLLATQMSKASRERARSYDYRIVADQLARLYSKILLNTAGE